MPLSHNTKWYAVDDARLAKVTADTSGGAITYGTLLDIPGIKSIGITGDVNSVELRGDGQRIDQASKLGGLSLTFEFAKSSLDVFSAIAGGTIVDSGTTPNQKAVWTLLGTDALNYFKFEAQTKGVDTITGDGHILLPKLILTSFPSLATPMRTTRRSAWKRQHCRRSRPTRSSNGRSTKPLRSSSNRRRTSAIQHGARVPGHTVGAVRFSI